ncbi:MAG: hypothetical protein ACR2JY_03485 [Chloroflexota bacterium]
MPDRDASPDLTRIVERYWSLSLGLGVVVTGAVALLLTVLSRTTGKIDGGVAEIWQSGQLLANNTVHIPLLTRTNQIVGAILPGADGIAAATARIQRAVVGDEAAAGPRP